MADLTASSAVPHTDPASRPPVYRVIGIVLAVCSGLFIGVSFVLKKKGLLKANAKYNEQAGDGYGYLKNALWWAGMTLMILGELCNFVAYAFVDAIMVTPLGALSVVVTTILSAIFLKERLSFVGKVGCFNCIVGSVVILLNAPEQASVATIQQMKKFVIAPGFLTYAGIVIVGCTFTAVWAGPRYGKKSMLVYLTICSMIGGLSVVATQGLGAAIVSQIAGTPQFNQWFLYVLLAFVLATLVTEIIYLNKALNIFNAALVTPTYYVYFTSATIVTSAILFQGFKGTAMSISTVIMGFLQICSGVVLLQLAKSSKDVPDTAVFKGDLDQVRTIGEQEEPESEPRADTIRGGAAILRAVSKRRTLRQVQEVEKLHGEHMAPVGENEVVEWDGLRRRKTVLDTNASGLSRTKASHPPLGMSRFPDDHEMAHDSESHTGLSRVRRSMHKSKRSDFTAEDLPLPLAMTARTRDYESGPAGPWRDLDGTSSHLRSTIRPVTSVHFDDDSHSHRSTASTDFGVAPAISPDAHKRTFSFTRVFNRPNHHREPSYNRGPGLRSLSRGPIALSSMLGHHGRLQSADETEEERCGLVRGNSHVGYTHGDSPGPARSASPTIRIDTEIASVNGSLDFDTRSQDSGRDVPRGPEAGPNGARARDRASFGMQPTNVREHLS